MLVHSVAISYCAVTMYFSIITGLPQKEKNKLENIHFVCCSNKTNTLELARPIVEDLIELEDGVRMHDEVLKQEVLVRAPVIFILGDNPMCSELCNHQGSTARRFCRICLVRSLLLLNNNR